MQARIFTLCAVAFFLAMNCRAQFAENITASFNDSLATITYDLIGVRSGELYSVEVYSSHNYYSSPLQRVSGAVGKNISDGKGKIITWRFTEEVPGYKGNLSFHIKAEIVFRPLEFIIPRGGYVRRGHAKIIEWTGGLRTGQTSTKKELELYRKGEPVASLGTVEIWCYTWTVPKDLKKGRGYTLRLSGGGESAESKPFRVRSRTPFLLKISPIIAIAAIIPFLGEKSSGNNALPGAPIPE